MKGKIAIIAVLLCVVSYFLYNQSNKAKEAIQQKESSLVEGHVFSKTTSKPLSGVTIAIRGYNPIASTDDDGHFYIDAKKTDDLMLQKEGYASQIINASQTEKIYMYPLDEKE